MAIVAFFAGPGGTKRNHLSDETARCDVCVVVDPSYAGRLEELAKEVPVWIVGSPVNKEACKRIWDGQPPVLVDHRLPGSVTSYDVSDPQDRASNLLHVFPMLEDHYGAPDQHGYVPLPSDPEELYLHLPDGFRLSVVGLNLTPDLERGLGDFGLQSFLPTPLGFQALVIRRRVG